MSAATSPGGIRRRDQIGRPLLLFSIACNLALLAVMLNHYRNNSEPAPLGVSGPPIPRHTCKAAPPELHYTAPDCCGLEPLHCTWTEQGRDNFIVERTTVRGE